MKIDCFWPHRGIAHIWSVGALGDSRPVILYARSSVLVFRFQPGAMALMKRTRREESKKTKKKKKNCHDTGKSETQTNTPCLRVGVWFIPSPRPKTRQTALILFYYICFFSLLSVCLFTGERNTRTKPRSTKKQNKVMPAKTNKFAQHPGKNKMNALCGNARLRNTLNSLLATPMGKEIF